MLGLILERLKVLMRQVITLLLFKKGKEEKFVKPEEIAISKKLDFIE